jgi:hypothetical protein
MRWNIIVECVGEHGKQSTITLGAIELLAVSTTAENLGASKSSPQTVKVTLCPPDGSSSSSGQIELSFGQQVSAGQYCSTSLESTICCRPF